MSHTEYTHLLVFVAIRESLILSSSSTNDTSVSVSTCVHNFKISIFTFQTLLLDLQTSCCGRRWSARRSSPYVQYHVQSALLLDVLVAQCAAIIELFIGKNQTLLIWCDAFLVLDLGLDISDGVRWFDFQSKYKIKMNKKIRFS